jgi:aryl-alcohol dehydrogenase-like predicted oxidoreductase
VPPDQIAAILDEARAVGVDTLDTAMDYGDSEERLGNAGVRDFRIVSKLSELPPGHTDVTSWVRDAVLSSVSRLGVSALEGLLFHHPMQLLSARGPEIFSALLAVKREGLVGKLGVSVYSPEDLEPLMSKYPIELVQAPLNVFDRRLVTTGWMRRLHTAGVEIHARSIFLQGLLVMPPHIRPRLFDHWDDYFDRWHRWLNTVGYSPVQGCIAFVGAYPEVSRVVVGVENRRQFRQVRTGFDLPPADPPLSLICDDRGLIDPSRWPSP